MNDALSTNEPLRWGILGPGDIAGTFADSLRRTPGATCVAVGSRSSDRARRFAADHGVPHAHGSYEALVQDPEVDVVYVATPQALHHRHARLALESGRGVLVEKPMAMTYEETEDLVALAVEQRLFLMEGLWTLCNPLVRRLGELVTGGGHGGLEAMFSNCGPLALPRGHRALDASAGGGFYREVLVYPLALWLAMTDLEPVEDVQARGHLRADADYAATATVTTADGRFATTSGAFAQGVAASVESRAHLVLGSAWADLDDVFKPTRLRVAHDDQLDIQRLEGDQGVDFEYEITEVVEAFRDGRTESRAVSHALSLSLAALLDRVAAQLHPSKASHAPH